MEDPEVVAAIVAGDPAGLAEAYDGYAEPLYSYCRSMLREPADAADAVQDTFLVATAKVRNLRDPGKLRSWLYAVARNECLRRLRAGNALSALEEAPDMPIQTSDIGIAAERAELQQLVRDAVDGLNQGERDVIELSLGHGLDGDELADALGVSRNHAHAQLSRARSQLERSLGALIVARTGRQACPDLDAMLTGWPASRPALRRGVGGSTHGASAAASSPSSARGGPSGHGGNGGNGGNGSAPSVLTSGGTSAPKAFRSPGTPGSAASANPTPTVGSSSLPSGSSSSSASAGTSSVSTGQLDLVSVNGTSTGTFTLTATGGPVSDYSIAVGSTLAGRVTVSPSSGSLASGASVRITVTSTSLVALDGHLTVNPGGQTITVLLSIGL